MNNETLNRLNAFIADYKAEFAEKDALITDLQDRLLKTEHSIDGDCVGCCKVVDVAANLQKDLDEVRGILISKDDVIINLYETIDNFKTIETQETDRLHKIILDMDVTISDLMDNDRKINGFLDEYRATVDNRDKTIGEKDKMLEKYRREIVGLRDMHDVVWDKVHALEAELSEKQEIIDNITSLRVDEVETLYNLKAELSARKADSDVLMKVVDAIKAMTEDARTCPQIEHLSIIVRDCLDAPEGPPETPIDDLYKVTVSYAFLEMP